MTKFILVMYMCSMLTQQCNNGLYINQEYNSHYDCAVNGYKLASDAIKNMDENLVNDNRLAVKFECRPYNIIIPKKKPA